MSSPLSPPLLHIPEPVLADLTGRAVAGFPHEVCGFMIGRRGQRGIAVRSVFPSTNQAPMNRENRFLVDPRRLMALEELLEDTGEQVVGLYHSHLDRDAEPSPLDHATAAAWPTMCWLILGMRFGQPLRCRSWWLVGNKLQEQGLSKPDVRPVYWPVPA